MASKQHLYESLLCSNMKFEEYSSDRRKVVLINILLITSGIILGIFSFYNFFIAYNMKLFFIDFTGLVVSIGVFYDLKIAKNINRAATISSVLIFAVMFAIVYFGKGKDFTLIWSVFFPIFAIFINGSKKGLAFTTFFYALVFYVSYTGIDVWQEGAWNYASYSRYVVACVGITIIVYLFEVSFDKAYELLEKVRKKEQEYIETLKEYSITDPLTQLYNRRYLTQQYGKMFDKAKKHNSFFAFYIFDLDLFKQYNDTFGHIAGDTALTKISKVLTTEVFKRDVDYLFRLGGEEFCGILIAEDIHKIERNVEKARKAIEGLQLKHPGNKSGFLTASFGVAIIHSFEVRDFDKIYKIADQALYEAKEQGRNCIVGADKVSTL